MNNKETNKTALRAALILLLDKLMEDDSFSRAEKNILLEAMNALEQEESIDGEKTLSEAPSVAITKIVTKYLMKLGVPAHIKGYAYLRTAVEMTVADPSLLEAVTKCLYPEIAKKYGSSSSKVERAIRHAIEVSASKEENSELKKEIFGWDYSEGPKPTNSHFIAALAEHIRMQQLS